MEMNEALGTIQMQKSVIASYARQLELLELTLSEHTRAKETLEGLKDKEAGSEMLVPVGGGTMISGTLGDDSRVIVAVGAGVEIEMPVEDAISHHTSQINRLNEEKARISSKLKELETENAYLTQAVEQAYAHQMHQHEHTHSQADAGLSNLKVMKDLR